MPFSQEFQSAIIKRKHKKETRFDDYDENMVPDDDYKRLGQCCSRCCDAHSIEVFLKCQTEMFIGV